MLDHRKLLGDNVRKARRDLGISQETLGLDAGIDRTYISGIERGLRNPSLDVIVTIAKCLKVTAQSLLSDIEG
jgi:transcriptional regulator with XRE-family HTH domain